MILIKNLDKKGGHLKMAINRYKVMQNIDGIKAQLKEAVNRVDSLYENTQSTVEERREAENNVRDLKERLSKYENDLRELDEEAKNALKSQQINKSVDPKNKKESATASLIRNTMAGRPVGSEILNVLGDGVALGNGQSILPSTLLTELVTEPYAKNPLRGISTFTNITNLEIPKLAFTLGDDEFLTSDNETAKEMAASASTIQFGRKKFKVFCDITETVLRGTDTALVAHVENGLRSGMAKKEKKIAFAEGTTNADTSFYNKTGSTYDIKEIKKESLYKAIKAALADLEDDYSDNAKIVMRKTDYFDIIESLANNNATLYQAQPESILGAPVVFCDLAKVPVIGDFGYSHFNYDLDVTYESDKNVKTGVTSFVLTGYLDHKIKLKSAFRLATVGVGEK